MGANYFIFMVLERGREAGTCAPPPPIFFAMSTYLIVDSSLTLIHFRLSYFPLAFRLFPPWGINQNLSERKIKTRPIELDRVSFYIRCTVINSLRELITKVMWFSDRHKIQDNIYRAK